MCPRGGARSVARDERRRAIRQRYIVSGARGLRYLVTGARDYADWSLMRRFVASLPPGSTVIHGDAPGADSMVERVLTQNRPTRARAIRVHGEDGTVGRRAGGSSRGDIDIEVYPADWDRHRPAGRRKNPAGMIRNKRMLDDGRPDRCVYFHDNLDGSQGTRDMVRKCLKAKVPVYEAEDFVRLMRTGAAV